MGYQKKDPIRISNTNANRKPIASETEAHPIETGAGAAACEAAVKTT